METRTNKTQFPTKPITVDVANAISKSGQTPPLYFHIILQKLFICTYKDNLQRGSQPVTIYQASNTDMTRAMIETGTHKAVKTTVEISLKSNKTI